MSVSRPDRGLGRLRHLVVERVRRVGRDSRAAVAFSARSCGEAPDDGSRVSFASPRSARLRGGLEQPLAHRAVRERRLQRLLGGVLQREHPLALQPRVLGRLGGGGDVAVAQPVELGAVVDDQRAGLGRGQQLVLELGGELRLLLVERA